MPTETFCRYFEGNELGSNCPSSAILLADLTYRKFFTRLGSIQPSGTLFCTLGLCEGKETDARKCSLILGLASD